MTPRTPRLVSAALAGAVALAPFTLPAPASAAPAAAPTASAVRDVAVDGAVNVRDIGGYASKDGRHVRYGLVYRSASLSKVTATGVAQLQRLGLTASVDFRSQLEVGMSGADKLPAGVTPVAANINAFSPTLLTMVPDLLKAVLAQDKPGEFMALSYRGFVHDPDSRKQFAAALTRIASGQGPVLYHCTEGKDRTGVMTAILLTILGVPKTQVYADYLRSNEELADQNAAELAELQKLGIDPALVEPFLTVRASYLDTAFDQIKRDYGTFGAFVAKGLGIDAATQAALRKQLLQ
ncbi:tyrosine-protein phosphatase [Actinomadura montaniterrae]|uniref:Tyrosine-protein phosphatase n=1 Tax=Actinomadura montaniterrae TaxID=1803903 RepID=A0A6L3VRY0_9ACTN|nr:tyrosine-protein phosphatase [Actinomadura montaniterrae]KAB2373227.1 tyrosine-protein phosphatase [Actinomadura montaniterrae]